MSKTEIIIALLIIFVLAGFLAYAIESIIYRNMGKMGRYENLLNHFKKIDQKEGNITAAIWGGIWVALMMLGGLILYLVS